MMSKQGGEKQQPLKGLAVLDFTRNLPGPVCTMLLADYGATVIKVEDTSSGDPARNLGIYPSSSIEGILFKQVNRNKKSLAVNLKDEAGREVVEKMAARVDLVVEGFRPGVMERLGLGYKHLSKVNERIIYVSISGYGQEGSYRNRAGHDLNYLALTGLLDLSSAEKEPPVMPTVQIADIAGGSLMALNGIFIALFKRERTGKGDFVDISMARGLLPFLTYPASGLSESGELPRRGKSLITGAYACYNLYETADGKYMSLGALEPVFWRRFCETVGRTDWIPRQFSEENRESLIEEVQQLFKSKKRSNWENIFAEVDACCEPVLDLNEAMVHPFGRQQNCWIDWPPDELSSSEKNSYKVNLENDHKEQTEKMIGFPLLFSGQGGEVRLGSPRHGEHTFEVLADFGFDEAKIESLKQKKVIFG